MKKSMKIYFDKLLEGWRELNNSYPKVEFNEMVEPKIYQGDMDEDEYICWKPLEKDLVHDFTEIEKVLGITLHESIKSYFNTYWFLELAGFYKGRNIVLDPVLPGIELKSFILSIVGYRKSHGDQLENIPIGMDTKNGFMVVVDNINGFVKIENYETKEFEIISDSVENLISKIELNR